MKQIYINDLYGDNQYFARVDNEDELEIGAIDGNSRDERSLVFLSRGDAVSIAKSILNHYEPLPEIRVGLWNNENLGDIIEKIKQASIGTNISVTCR